MHSRRPAAPPLFRVAEHPRGAGVPYFYYERCSVFLADFFPLRRTSLKKSVLLHGWRR